MVIKLIKTKNDQDVALARDEAKVLKSLSHQFIVRYIDEYESKNTRGFFDGGTKEVRIVMEYCDNGDMSAHVRAQAQQKDTKLANNQRVWFEEQHIL